MPEPLTKLRSIALLLAMLSGGWTGKLQFQDDTPIPAPIVKVSQELGRDCQVFERIGYKSTYTYKLLAIRRQARNGDLSQLEYVDYEQPPVARGTLELRRSSVAQWLRVEPIETHPDLKWASINEPYTYHHANTVYTTVRHDLHTVSIGHEDQVANRPYEMFLPHQLFELCLSEKWPFVFSGVSERIFQRYDLPDAVVHRRVVPTEGEPSPDITVEEELTVHGVRNRNGPCHGKRVARYAATQAWRPTQIQWHSSHELNYTFHVQWSLLRDTDGREIWFPSTMKVTMHSQRSSQPGAERIITVQTEFEIDPKSVVWGDPAENLDTSIQIPQGMTVRDLRTPPKPTNRMRRQNMNPAGP